MDVFRSKRMSGEWRKGAHQLVEEIPGVSTAIRGTNTHSRSSIVWPIGIS